MTLYLCKCDFGGIRTRVPKKSLNGKAYTDAAQRASVLSYTTPQRRAGRRACSGGVYTCMLGYIDSSILHWWADILWYRDISQPIGALAPRVPFRQWSTDGKCWIGCIQRSWVCFALRPVVSEFQTDFQANSAIWKFNIQRTLFSVKSWSRCHLSGFQE